MEALIKRLREEAAALHVQARGILDEHQDKALPEEKSKQVDRLYDDFDAKIAEADRLERSLKADKFLNDPKTRLPGPVAPGGTNPDDKGAPTPELKAFRKFLKGGVRVLDAEESKALSASDDAAGGFAIAPQQFSLELLKFVDDLVVVRQLGRVEQIGQAESLGVLSLDADLADWDWTTELQTGAEDTVKPFGKRALTPHPVAKRIKISNTLIRRSVRPIETIASERIAYKLGVTQEKAYMTGDGSQKPLGMFVADANGIPTSRDVTYTDTNDTTRSDSLVDAKFFLKAQYQASPTTRWLLHRDFLKRIRKYRDANGLFLWNAGLGLVNGNPATILDIPYVQSEFAPNTFTSGLYIAILGDIKFYWMVDSLQMTLQVLNELYAETNQRGYIARYEGDGQPMLAEAFARVKVA